VTVTTVARSICTDLPRNRSEGSLPRLNRPPSRLGAFRLNRHPSHPGAPPNLQAEGGYLCDATSAQVNSPLSHSHLTQRPYTGWTAIPSTSGLQAWTNRAGNVAETQQWASKHCPFWIGMKPSDPATTCMGLGGHAPIPKTTSAWQTTTLHETNSSGSSSNATCSSNQPTR
jgi:hypothetical protein